MYLRVSLSERLLRRPGEAVEPVPADLLRKYIAYARAWAFPKLDSGARSVLQEFYLELRRLHHRSGDCAPITLRQLESLVRLTEARAKVELREEATAEDARDVVEIMRASMADTLSPGLAGGPGLDFSRSIHGSGTSTRGAHKKFVAALQRHAEATGRNIFEVDEMKKVMAACGIRVPSFADFLETLNTQGFLLKRGSNQYKLLTV